jgi:hypothetical protein
LFSASNISQPVSSIHESEAGETFEKKINVEEFTKQLDISVVGTEPNLMLTDPNDETYFGDTQDGESVLSIKNPVAGEWTLIADDTSKFKTEIGISYEIPLDYGFSVQKPKSLKETMKSPPKGMALYSNFISTYLFAR